MRIDYIIKKKINKNFLKERGLENSKTNNGENLTDSKNDKEVHNFYKVKINLVYFLIHWIEILHIHFIRHYCYF